MIIMDEHKALAQIQAIYLRKQPEKITQMLAVDALNSQHNQGDLKLPKKGKCMSPYEIELAE